jgi:SPOR domain/Sel1 repeat
MGGSAARGLRCALAVCLWGCACLAWGGAIEDGVVAYVGGDYSQALHLLEPAAEQGNSTALLFLGLMYEYGHGVAKDRSRALRYYKEAAAAGDPDARRILSFVDAGTSETSASARERTEKQEQEQQPAAPHNAPVPAAAPPAETTSSATVAPAPVSGLRGIPWISAQDSRHYTLQLMGSRSKEELVQFARDHKIQDDAAIYTHMRHGKPWFGLLYGAFPTRDSANAALRALPPAARAWSPWVRSFAEIKEVIGDKAAGASRGSGG